MLDLSSKLVVGVDVHKRNHTAVLVNQFCQKIESYEITNTQENITSFLNQVKEQSNLHQKQIIFALEDTNGNGYSLSKIINQQGYDIYSIPPQLTKRERRKSTHCDKNDLIDAQRVAKVMLLDSDKLNKFVYTDNLELSNELGALVDDRETLTKNITGLKNQLHVILHKIFGNQYENSVTKRDIFCKFGLKQWRYLLSENDSYEAQRAIVKMNLLDQLRNEVIIIDKRLEEYSKKIKDVELLKSIPGCGTLTASIIFSEIKDIRRFSSVDALAKYAGIAPRIFESNRKGRHFSDKRGNRRLNCAIYQIALSLISRMGVDVSKEYYLKKRKQGKSGKQALKCLSKQMLKVIFAVLSNKKIYQNPC